MMRIYRGWINQPSTLQPLHDMHGTKCIVQDNGSDGVRLWFTDGPIHSMEASRLCISEIKLSGAQCNYTDVTRCPICSKK